MANYATLEEAFENNIEKYYNSKSKSKSKSKETFNPEPEAFEPESFDQEKYEQIQYDIEPKQSRPINELFEYSENDNIPINRENFKNKSNKKKRKKRKVNVKKSPSEMEHFTSFENNNNSTFEKMTELEKKIEYFIENFAPSNVNTNSSLINNNNKHDIILFVLFGIFVLLVFESMYNLTLKMHKS